ncbi:MAG: hypothetical protein KC457_36790, partial [Myxococcales bacterium]|nr:hypothetical protein [Myxococcales bacterium]
RLAIMGVHEDPVAVARERLAEVHERLCAHLEVATFAEARPKLHAIAAARPEPGQVVPGYREANRRCVDFVRDRGLFDLPADFEVPLSPLVPGGEVMTDAGNLPAPLFGEGGGSFVVLDDAARHPLHWMVPLSVHEGVPGHYLQSWLWQQRFRGRAARAPPASVSVPDPPAAARTAWGGMVRSEGWAGCAAA